MRVAFVLTERAGAPAAGPVLAAYQELSREGPSVLADAESADLLELKSASGDRFHVAAMPGPVPDGEADAMAPFSVSALGTGWSLAEHAAHLVVVHQPAEGGDKLAGLVLFTRVVGAVAKATSAVGIYVGDARATHDPDFFCDVAREELPVALWTGLSVATPAPDRVSLLSLGMRALGLPNLELVAPRRESENALAFFFDLLGYVVRRGAPIPDGDSLGRTAEEKLVARYIPSPILEGDEVLYLELPSSGPVE